MISHRRFIFSLLLTLFVISGGIFGYMSIEGWSFSESLYMTIITISTVGFQEANSLSPAGKDFTIIFIIFSIFTVGYTVTSLISYIFEGQIAEAMKERKMKKKLFQIKNHYIICGFGSVGRETAHELFDQKIPFIIMEKNLGLINQANYPKYLFIEGNATEEEDLEKAGIHKAAGLISSLSDDHQNVFVVLTARQLNSKLRIVSRSADEKTIEKLKKAGADRVISPQLIAGQRLAAVIHQPAIVDFLDIISRKKNNNLQIHSIKIPTDSALIGNSLRNSNIGKFTGAIIIGIIAPDGSTRINPSSGTTLASIKLNDGDELIALGSEEQAATLQDFCKKTK